jgi:hypothetical protein
MTLKSWSRYNLLKSSNNIIHLILDLKKNTNHLMINVNKELIYR